MECMNCYHDMEDGYQNYSVDCENCGEEHYICCQCGDVSLDTMHYDDEWGYIWKVVLIQK